MGRNLGVLRQAAGDLGAVAIGCDIESEESVTHAFAAAAERGLIGILINNSGAAESAPFARTSTELFERMVRVNLTGTFFCTRAVLPAMLAAKRGRIVNIASTAGLRGYAYVAAYAAAKHGVIGMTRSLALEVARTGITVNAVCPGFTDTDLVAESVERIVAKTGRDAESARAELAATNPQGRLIRPEEVADAVGFLCLPSSAAMNGQSIAIAGGEVM
jgi:NAD(P)-dependent dehydrogenase (short-subunit alcohol dehydrogenase family)